MKFSDFKVGMEVRVKVNADSLTMHDSSSRSLGCVFLIALHGKTGKVVNCVESDQTIKVIIESGCVSGDWFDAVHLELVPAKVTLKSLQDEVVLHAMRAKTARADLDAFLLKSKVYSFGELSTIAPNGMYKCDDAFVYASRFVISNNTIVQIDASGFIRIPRSIDWLNEKFVQVDASYKVTITEVAQ